MPAADDPHDDWGEGDYSGFDTSGEDADNASGEDADNTSGEDADATVPCPHCGADIFDDAERCPKCGKYLSREDSPATHKPLWVVAGAVICLLIAVTWIFGGC